jgi:hypothetical protein
MLRAVCTSFVLTALAIGQPVVYVDSYIAKVKPEKRADFDALAKRMAEANRAHKGDNWTASQVEFGEQHTLYFTAGRTNLAAIDAGMKAFDTAIKEAYGTAAAEKLMQDIDKCLISARTELRRIRPDLSSNAPADPADLFKVIGKSRLIRMTMVRVRPGKELDAEAQVRMVKEANERGKGEHVMLVSQSVAGREGNAFYISTWGSSLASWDNMQPLPKLLGDEGFARFSKMASENIFGTETIILRYLPELSNPPEQVVQADPEFWKPKPAPVKKTGDQR